MLRADPAQTIARSLRGDPKIVRELGRSQFMTPTLLCSGGE